MEYPEPENTVWQTRLGKEPTDYEKALCEALEAIFDDGVSAIVGVVERLNQTNLQPEGGGVWTTDSFQAEMKRLAG